MFDGEKSKPGRVSVVIPALNEEDSIGDLLDMLSEQTRPPDEVIIVDAGSTDGTVAQIRVRTGRLRRLHVIEGHAAFPGRARNLGARAADGEWILFLDCGTSIDRDCIEKLLKRAASAKAEVVYGRVVPQTGTLFAEAAAIAYVPPGMRNRRITPLPTVNIMLLRRAVFEAAGGFCEALRSAEDLRFLKALEALKVEVVCAPEAVSRWRLAGDFRSTFRRFRTYSFFNIEAGLFGRWQRRILFYYSILTVITVVLWQYSPPMLLVAPFLMFVGLRALRSLWIHREDMPASMVRNLLRFWIVSAVVVCVDAATIVGIGDYVVKRLRDTWPGVSDAAGKAGS